MKGFDVMSLKTGFKNLDNIINLKEGELTCIASRPGVGKTTLAIDIVNNISKQINTKILFVSLENSKEQIEKRFINNNIEIITDKLFLIDILKKCREFKNISLIAIDYLQLIKRESEDVIKELKNLALELNVPIIITSQLPRTYDKKILKDFDIFGSENYDNVLLLYKLSENEIKVSVKNKNIDLFFNYDKLKFEEN